MNWLEITISTTAADIQAAAAALTAGGFDDLVLEDQEEFSTFLDQNRAYWDYIDEALQKKMQGLSCIKLYLESGDSQGLQRLKALLEELGLEMTVKPLPDMDWEESWKENYPPQPVGEKLIVMPY